MGRQGVLPQIGEAEAGKGRLQYQVGCIECQVTQDIDQDGFTSIVRTKGNPYGHVVLRGGRSRTNYDEASIAEAVCALKKSGSKPSIMVDCSHANSNKQHAQQEEVARIVVAQRAAGNVALTGLMLESFLNEGNQSVPANHADLKYGVSITDACLNWEATERILRNAHKTLGNK